MKKIIPIIATMGIGALLTGCNSVANVNEKESLENHIQTFQNQVEEFSNINNFETMNTKFAKYNLSIIPPENATRVSNDNIGIVAPATENLITEEADSNLNNEESDSNNQILEEINNEDLDLTYNNNIDNTNNENIVDNENNLNENEIDNINNEDINSISTLYSISSDISESCDDFCELKEEIAEAIIETQNLINKVQSNEISLTSEQRMFITEQAKQLKSLGKQLSNITTELSINLSDISTLMRDKNGNIDNLSLKYLVVLDNLVNGNEMLENGLQSLYMINSIFNTSNVDPNNQGRILYGFKRNDEPPIIKDYTINNGEIIENETSEDNATAISAEENEQKGNIDTYLNTNVNRNIDTYGNKYNNLDTFFNTALLDNELYGNGYGMYGNPGNPYYNYQNNLNPDNNTNYSVDNNTNKQDIEENKLDNTQIKERKRLKITKNIDTYRDENTPTISAKFAKIKDSVNGFFDKFKPRDNSENPIYKLTEKQRND